MLRNIPTINLTSDLLLGTLGSCEPCKHLSQTVALMGVFKLNYLIWFTLQYNDWMGFLSLRSQDM